MSPQSSVTEPTTDTADMVAILLALRWTAQNPLATLARLHVDSDHEPAVLDSRQDSVRHSVLAKFTSVNVTTVATATSSTHSVRSRESTLRALVGRVGGLDTQRCWCWKADDVSHTSSSLCRTSTRLCRGGTLFCCEMWPRRRGRLFPTFHGGISVVRLRRLPVLPPPNASPLRPGNKRRERGV